MIGHVHWGVAGFVAGTVFWHLVGFWDFMGRIVFHGSGPKPVDVTEAQAPPTVRSPRPRSAKLDGPLETADPIVTGSIARPAPCIELRRDPAGATSAVSCPGDAQPLRLGNFLRRGDRAAAADMSAAAVAVPAAPWSTTVSTDASETRIAERN